MNKDLITILLLDGIALFIIFYTGLTSSFLLKEKSKTNKLLRVMLYIVFFSSIIDALSYIFDARYGLVTANSFNDFMLVLTCSLLRISVIGGLISFDLFFVYRLNGSLNRARLIVLNSLVMVCVCMLIINIFHPFVFEIKDSIYYRINSGYMIFSVFAGIIFIDTICYYIYARIKGGMLKFFPIWFFLAPMIVMGIVQYFLPDISTVWIGTALSVNVMLLALQNDTIFRDKLTKLYNRVFLDLVKKLMEKSSRSKKFTAMMLDLNGFKLINDNYGHQVGDEALIATGELLREAVGTYGAVIRFAGDEFIVILNTQEDKTINKVVNNIDNVFDNFNECGNTEYKLSISLGYSKVDLKDSSIDDIMKEIDEKMYIDKQQKHKEHPEWDR